MGSFDQDSDRPSVDGLFHGDLTTEIEKVTKPIHGDSIEFAVRRIVSHYQRVTKNNSLSFSGWWFQAL